MKGKMLCVCCGMWRWWRKRLVCMMSLLKYVFSLHSASFLPSLSCLSPCVFVCLCVCFILSLYSESCNCWCLRMFLQRLLCPTSCVTSVRVWERVCVRARVCVCVSVCVQQCVCGQQRYEFLSACRYFEAVTAGGSHYVSACTLQVGRRYLPSAHQQQTEKEEGGRFGGYQTHSLAQAGKKCLLQPI